MDIRITKQTSNKSAEGKDDFYLFDDVLNISVTNLQLLALPHETVTNPQRVLQVSVTVTDSAKRRFYSTVLFTLKDANQREFHFGRQEMDFALTSKQFHFPKERLMGLFEVLTVVEGQDVGTRFQQTKVEEPVVNEIVFTLKNAQSMETIQEGKKTFFRYYFDNRVVERIEFKTPFVGTLFRLKNSSNKQQQSSVPFIVDLFGTGGGLVEFRASLMASRSVGNVLALAYFNVKGSTLPKAWNDVPISYFKRVFDFYLEGKFQVDGFTSAERAKRGIGMVGVSLGGEMCFLLNALFPSIIRKLVIINGSSLIWSDFKLHENGPALTGGKMETEKISVLPNSNDDVYSMMPIWLSQMEKIKSDYETEFPMIPLEKIETPILFFVSRDDGNWPSQAFAEIAKQRLKRNNKDHLLQIVHYEQAGHLLELPYSSVCSVSYHGVLGITLSMGGVPIPHAVAQEDAWKRMIEFFQSSTSLQKSNI